MAEDAARRIIETIGGPGNIDSLTHCATRLRFQLHDSSRVDTAAMEKIPGVMGAVPQSGNRYQVVIGGAVASVYDEINHLPEMAQAAAAAPKSDADLKAELRASGVRGRFGWVDNFFEFLSDSFRPIMAPLLGASLIIAIAAMLEAFGVVKFHDPNRNATWTFYDTMWHCVFFFLPIMVAYNGAKKLKVDPWLGAAVMGALMTPEFAKLGATKYVETAAGSGLYKPVQSFANTVCTTNHSLGTQSCVAHIFGLPMQLNDYSGQVFVPLMMVAVLALVYRGLKKIFPQNLQMVFVPFFSLLILVPITAFLLGPIGVWLGTGLGQGLAYLNNHAPIVFAIIIPLLYPFLVPLGLHWPLNALMLLNIQTLGYDFIQGPMGSWNFACFGATAAVLLLSMRAKDHGMTQTATGALAAGLLGGISEPSLYGIHLRFKRIYPSMLVGCLVGGVITGVLHGVKTDAFAFTSVLTIPVFNPIWKYALAITVAFLTSMAVVLVRGYKDPEPKVAVSAAGATAAGSSAPITPAGAAAPTAAVATDEATKTPKPAMVPGTITEVTAPLAGRVVPLGEVPDPVFAKGTVGLGVGIDPSGDTVYAPAAGKVVVAQATGHAFGLSLDNGIELLIHVGIDTVNLEGKGFQVKVAKGDRVEAGTPLVTFDRGIIEQAGYSLVTPVLVTNPKKFASADPVASGDVQVGDVLFSTNAKPAN